MKTEEEQNESDAAALIAMLNDVPRRNIFDPYYTVLYPTSREFKDTMFNVDASVDFKQKGMSVSFYVVRKTFLTVDTNPVLITSGMLILSYSVRSTNYVLIHNVTTDETVHSINLTKDDCEKIVTAMKEYDATLFVRKLLS